MNAAWGSPGAGSSGFARDESPMQVCVGGDDGGGGGDEMALGDVDEKRKR